MDKKEDKIKLMIVGNHAVGKSSILLKFTKNEFDPRIIGTTGVDLQKKYFEYEGKTYKVNVFDSAGHERFRHITYSYLKNADGLILVYDMTDKQSFEDISEWIKDIKEKNGKLLNIVIAGNKADLDDFRTVDKDKIYEIKEKYGYHALETSALTGYNIDELFKLLIEGIIESKKEEKEKEVKEEKEVNVSDPKEESVSLKKKKSKYKCCVVN